jgi:GAF domain-containing protein
MIVERSGAQYACVIIAQENGDFNLATTMIPPGNCQLHDMQKSMRNLPDPLQQAVIRHSKPSLRAMSKKLDLISGTALNHKEAYHSSNVADDARFASEATVSPYSSIISLPIHGNRGQIHGVVYLASEYRSAFTSNTLAVLTLLCEQVRISIANALLFRSVQAGTRENLKMIASQNKALDQARKHREEAEKATTAKSNFLASMSHELR